MKERRIGAPLVLVILATARIYGHSAGSQFVHRFLMTRPDAPVERAVAANAGWYTLPDDECRLAVRTGRFALMAPRAAEILAR